MTWPGGSPGGWPWRTCRPRRCSPQNWTCLLPPPPTRRRHPGVADAGRGLRQVHREARVAGEASPPCACGDRRRPRRAVQRGAPHPIRPHLLGLLHDRCRALSAVFRFRMQLHSYPCAPATSTIIGEMREEAWRASGFAELPVAESVRRCAESSRMRSADCRCGLAPRCGPGPEQGYTGPGRLGRHRTAGRSRRPVGGTAVMVRAGELGGVGARRCGTRPPAPLRGVGNCENDPVRSHPTPCTSGVLAPPTPPPSPPSASIRRTGRRGGRNPCGARPRTRRSPPVPPSAGQPARGRSR